MNETANEKFNQLSKEIKVYAQAVEDAQEALASAESEIVELIESLAEEDN